MKSSVRAVVIGGGIGGCSALYHLTQEGWKDVVLLERDELTSGTTWHSAAQVTNFGTVQTMIGLKTHSIELYKELASDPDYPINYHHATGGLRLASTSDHVDGYRHFISMAKGLGVEFELIDPDECKKRHPLITKENLMGALWDPLDGDIDPAQLCQALARRARKAGAEIYRQTPVTSLTQKPGGEWIVHTENGDIVAEHVVNAGGYRCNEISAMMGVQLPVVSMEHQYFLTEPIAEIEALGFRVPLIRCPTDDFYSRQEKSGLLVGFYEQDCRTWGLEGIDPAFSNALCPDDPDRVVPVLENVFRRLPCLMEAGIHTIINGPITYTPDGLPLVGKIPGKRNAWCITGLRAGLGEGGGHGWLLAQMMVRGEACYDTWCLDPRRFGTWANQEYTALKAIEDYQNEFRFHMPHEFRPAGRPVRTTPLYNTLKLAGAEFGTVAGWERALYFKSSPDFEEKHSFRFNNTFELVAGEIKAVQDRVGLMEVSGFSRFKISGEGVHDWLDGIMCSRVPRQIGRVGLCYFLNADGNIKGEATLANLADDAVWYGSAAAADSHDMDWLSVHLPEDSSIRIESLTETHTILALAGPKSCDLLQQVAPNDDWSKEGFPWLNVRKIHIGSHTIIALSVSFSGELAWELHVPNSSLEDTYHTLVAAGEAFGLAHFGLYAAESMRLEKGYRHWKADLITEFNPIESGLERFVNWNKQFHGKSGLQDQVRNGIRKLFVSMVLDGVHAPAHPGDSILANGKVIGTVTSAGWGHRINRNLAMGFIDPAFAETGTQVQLEVIGDPVTATVCEACQYDRESRLVRR